MATYVLGDIQGCYDQLRKLLDQLAFDPAKDQVWFVGDLVNRGPKSLKVLRFVRKLGDSAVTVLGNHDLHLLAMACGNKRDKDSASLQPILDAPDRDKLIHWLRHRPLLHQDKALGFTMIHAGLPPQWNMKTAVACAREVEAVLQGKDHRKYFKAMYGNEPSLWDPGLKEMERWRFITNCFTRLRYCSTSGQLGLKQKGPPGSQKSDYLPWFSHPKRATRKDKVLFGHWSTLGYQVQNNTWSLDSGCLWGGKLTALRIDLKKPKPRFLSCPGQQDPGKFS